MLKNLRHKRISKHLHNFPSNFLVYAPVSKACVLINVTSHIHDDAFKAKEFMPRSCLCVKKLRQYSRQRKAFHVALGFIIALSLSLFLTLQKENILQKKKQLLPTLFLKIRERKEIN
jgi:hypothetical protein